MDKNELFWNLYLSERDFIKHHENQRTTASNILAAIAAGLIVGAGSHNMENKIQLAIASMLMMIGLFGYLFCGKLTALIKLHGERSYEYLSAIDDEDASSRIKGVRSHASAKNKREFMFFSRLPLNKVWAYFHLFILATGVIFLSLHINFSSLLKLLEKLSAS